MSRELGEEETGEGEQGRAQGSSPVHPSSSKLQRQSSFRISGRSEPPRGSLVARSVILSLRHPTPPVLVRRRTLFHCRAVLYFIAVPCSTLFPVLPSYVQFCSVLPCFIVSCSILPCSNLPCSIKRSTLPCLPFSAVLCLRAATARVGRPGVPFLPFVFPSSPLVPLFAVRIGGYSGVFRVRCFGGCNSYEGTLSLRLD